MAKGSKTGCRTGHALTSKLSKVMNQLILRKPQAQTSDSSPRTPTSITELTDYVNHNCAEIQTAIQIDVNLIDHRHTNGDTLLHSFTMRKCLRCCQFILNQSERNISIFEQNEVGITPLMLACERNDLKIAELFLKLAMETGECHVLLDQRTVLGESALHVAASCGYFYDNEACHLLLNYGANPNSQVVMGTTPLHDLVFQPLNKNHYIETLIEFIKAGARLDIDGCYEGVYSGQSVNQFQLAILLVNIAAIVVFTEAGCSMPAAFIDKNWYKLGEIRNNSRLATYIELNMRQPKSLQLLCRMSFRDHYTNRCRAIIELLDLPKAIKLYLNFEDLYDCCFDIINELKVDNHSSMSKDTF